MQCTKILRLAVVLLLPFTAIAQEMEEYTWEQFNIKFKIPVTLTITESSGEKFIAGNDDINVSLYPQTDLAYTKDDMKSALETWTKDNGVVFDAEKGALNLDDLNGYIGVYVDGTKNEVPVTTFLLIDKKKEKTSIFVWISYREAFFQKALEIISSFTPIEK